jgi:hypothetical protein
MLSLSGRTSSDGSMTRGSAAFLVSETLGTICALLHCLTTLHHSSSFERTGLGGEINAVSSEVLTAVPVETQSSLVNIYQHVGRPLPHSSSG